MGGCRRDELKELSINNIENLENNENKMYLVTIPKTKTNVAKQFTIKHP